MTDLQALFRALLISAALHVACFWPGVSGPGRLSSPALNARLSSAAVAAPIAASPAPASVVRQAPVPPQEWAPPSKTTSPQAADWSSARYVSTVPSTRATEAVPTSEQGLDAAGVRQLRFSLAMALRQMTAGKVSTESPVVARLTFSAQGVLLDVQRVQGSPEAFNQVDAMLRAAMKQVAIPVSLQGNPFSIDIECQS